MELLYFMVTGHWSKGSPVQRVTGPTVVVADVGTVSKGRAGTPCVNCVLVRDFKLVTLRTSDPSQYFICTLNLT